MTSAVPTVRVKHPLDPSVCMIINASDVTPEHQLWSDGTMSDFRVVKGPGGRWFIKRGAENVAGGFANEREAEVERVRLVDAA